MNNRIEDEIDKMINDLNSVNDDFINNYFDEEIEKDSNLEEDIQSDNTLEEKLPKEEKTFSYNEILNRLDEKVDLTDTDDVIELIDKANTPDDFFDNFEAEYNND